MKIKRVITGYLKENCYIVEEDNNVLIIDPGSDSINIKKEIGNKNVVGILITHFHADHIGALDEMENEYSIHHLKLEEGKHSIENFKFEVINTPGHTKDSVCYYFYSNNVMFTGDFLFKESIGRCDLEGGNYNEMLNSLDKIKKYNDDIIIYPGHGEKSSLGFEKDFNPYLNNSINY